MDTGGVVGDDLEHNFDSQSSQNGADLRSDQMDTSGNVNSNGNEGNGQGQKRQAEFEKNSGQGSQGQQKRMRTENYNNGNKSNGKNAKCELRVLLPSKDAGAIIGRAGANIKKLRTEHKTIIQVPDCDGPERLLFVAGDVDACLATILDVIPSLEEYNSSGKTFEFRLLVHQSQAGCIIGKSGDKIKELRLKHNLDMKVYSECAPMSTERICQMRGKAQDIVNCLRDVLDLLDTAPPKGMNRPYDPHNFNEFLSSQYGGYTSDKRQSMGNVGGGGRSGSNQGGGFAPRGGRSGGFGSSGGGGGGGSFGDRGDRGSGGRGGGFGQRGGFAGGGGGGFNQNMNDGGGMGRGGGQMGRGGFNQRGPAAGGGGGFGRGGPSRGGAGGPGERSGGRGGHGGSGGGGGRGGGGSFGGRGGGRGGGFGGQNQGGGGGFGSGGMNQGGFGQGPSQSSLNASGQNPNAVTNQVTIPNELAGAIIGPKGSKIQQIREQSGAGITIDKPITGSNDRIITITGTPEQIQNAQYLLQMTVKQSGLWQSQ